ncbi:GNAT family N-acetyltransferase [Modestobacter lapidis]|nr:GNAT family N-acetyltransferase [Modestobacter lapidis]
MAPLALLRCDAVPATGVGHLVRCLAVAEAAAAAGWRVLLVGEVSAPLAVQLVAAAGLSVHPAGTGPLDELAAGLGARVVHLDHYAVAGPPPGDPAAGDLLVSSVQDGRHGRRDAHVVVDASSLAEVTAAVVPAARVRLTGPRQALLREQVRHAAARRRADRAASSRVLVVAGGTDAAGIVPRLAAIAVEAVADPSVEILVLDPAATGTSRTPGGVVRRPPGADLVELAAGSRLVITASGTTTSELAVLGVPMAVVRAVDNQEETYSRLVSAGAALGLGSAADLDRDRDRLVQSLRGLVHDRVRLAALSEAAGAQVDGAGADRLVAAWTSVLDGRSAPGARGWWVGPARASDGDLLFRWRNDPETRARSLTTEAVPRAGHEAWLTGVLADPDRSLLMVGRGDARVGTVRFDRRATETWEVSITIAPEQRGRGRARTVLACGEEFLACRVAGRPTVVAQVRPDNHASRALFAAAGYRATGLGDPATGSVDRWEKPLPV